MVFFAQGKEVSVSSLFPSIPARRASQSLFKRLGTRQQQVQLDVGNKVYRRIHNTIIEHFQRENNFKTLTKTRIDTACFLP